MKRTPGSSLEIVIGSLKEHALSMRIDGVPIILRRTLAFAQFTWSFIFVLSFLCCLYLVVHSFNDFFQYQVSTVLRVDLQNRPNFPMVTMCSQNPLNTAYYIQLLNAANLTEALDADPYYNLVSLEDVQMQTTGSYFTLEQKQSMFDYDGFIISCTFWHKPCNASSFRRFFHRYRLNCLQFNSGLDSDGNAVELLKANADSGEYNELSVELYAGIPNEISSLISDRGVYLVITQNGEDLYKNAPSAIRVTPGIAMNIRVAENAYNRYNEWPYTYDECNVNGNNELLHPIDDTSLFDLVVAHNVTYAQDSCLLFCYLVNMYPICNCTDYWINYQIPGYGYCFGTQQDCANEFYYSVFSVGEYIAEHCVAKCPLECRSHRFDNYRSFYAYPEKLYVEQKLKTHPMLLERFANQTDFSDNLATNVVKFALYYDSLSYKDVTEEAKQTWRELVAIIGGHLHLFLGMSFISFVEIVELFMIGAGDYRQHIRLVNTNGLFLTRQM